jgi:DinB superfamily
MIGRPEPNESADYYHGYINRITSDDIVDVLKKQADETLGLLRGVSEEKSLHRYAPGKWSIRELLNHVNDAERVFLFRALWFARGYSDPLPSYEQDIAVAAAHADDYSWASHVEDFRSVRQSTLSLFQNLPEDAWLASGLASGNPVSVRALAYILAGHVAHHSAILRDRYLA